MKKLNLLMLGALAGAPFASAMDYQCRMTVYLTGAENNSSFTYSVPSPQRTETLDGYVAEVSSNDQGKLHIRLGLENKEGVDNTFPYSHTNGEDFPKSLSATLATAGATAAILKCER